MKELYRFRSTDALLDQYNELERQEIYFSPTNDLNDPMEDYKEFTWKGDEIIWKNFLKHYLLNLDRAVAIAVLSDDAEFSEFPKTEPFISHDELPTSMYKEKMNGIYDEFFSLDMVVEMMNFFTEQECEISSNELSNHLFMIHLKAIDILFREHGIFKDTEYGDVIRDVDYSSIFQAYKNLYSMEGDTFTVYVSIVFQLINDIRLSLALKSSNENNKKIQYLLVDFTEDYLESLKALVYPDWYVACFMTSMNNPIVWGHYAAGHNGACLIFDIDFDDVGGKYLDLNIPIYKEDSSVSSRKIRLNFSEVTYENKLPELSFFDNLGNVSGKLLKSQWYFDGDGNRSKCADEIYDDLDEWRQKHWLKFNEIQNTKTVHWEYEKEYRLVFDSWFYSLREIQVRKFKYDFNNLKGIVFGLKMSTEDKIKIINIVREKCIKYGRKDFEFYQAIYDKNENVIKPIKLALISS